MIEKGSLPEALGEAAVNAEREGAAMCVFEFGTEEAPRYGVASRREAADLKRSAAKLATYFCVRFIVSVPKLVERPVTEGYDIDAETEPGEPSD